MKSRAEALSQILEAVNHGNPISNFQLYATASVIVKVIEDQLESSEVAGRNYIFEKLDSFLEYFWMAIEPSDTSDRDPGKWLSAAQSQLETAQLKIDSIEE